MSIEESSIPTGNPTQKKRVEKIERIRKHFGGDVPEAHEWTPSDEALDFANMSDEDLANYLAQFNTFSGV